MSMPVTATTTSQPTLSTIEYPQQLALGQNLTQTSYASKMRPGEGVPGYVSSKVGSTEAFDEMTRRQLPVCQPLTIDTRLASASMPIARGASISDSTPDRELTSAITTVTKGAMINRLRAATITNRVQQQTAALYWDHLRALDDSLIGMASPISAVAFEEFDRFLASLPSYTASSFSDTAAIDSQSRVAASIACQNSDGLASIKGTLERILVERRFERHPNTRRPADDSYLRSICQSSVTLQRGYSFTTTATTTTATPTPTTLSRSQSERSDGILGRVDSRLCVGDMPECMYNMQMQRQNSDYTFEESLSDSQATSPSDRFPTGFAGRFDSAKFVTRSNEKLQRNQDWYQTSLGVERRTPFGSHRNFQSMGHDRYVRYDDATHSAGIQQRGRRSSVSSLFVQDRGYFTGSTTPFYYPTSGEESQEDLDSGYSSLPHTVSSHPLSDEGDVDSSTAKSLDTQSLRGNICQSSPMCTNVTQNALNAPLPRVVDLFSSSTINGYLSTFYTTTTAFFPRRVWKTRFYILKGHMLYRFKNDSMNSVMTDVLKMTPTSVVCVSDQFPGKQWCIEISGAVSSVQSTANTITSPTGSFKPTFADSSISSMRRSGSMSGRSALPATATPRTPPATWESKRWHVQARNPEELKEWLSKLKAAVIRAKYATRALPNPPSMGESSPPIVRTDTFGLVPPPLQAEPLDSLRLPAATRRTFATTTDIPDAVSTLNNPGRLSRSQSLSVGGTTGSIETTPSQVPVLPPTPVQNPAQYSDNQAVVSSQCTPHDGAEFKPLNEITDTVASPVPNIGHFDSENAQSCQCSQFNRDHHSSLQPQKQHCCDSSSSTSDSHELLDAQRAVLRRLHNVAMSQVHSDAGEISVSTPSSASLSPTSMASQSNSASSTYYHQLSNLTPVHEDDR